MEYALSSLVTLLWVVVLLRRPIKRAIRQAVNAPDHENDDELAMIIARERSGNLEETEAESPRVGDWKIAGTGEGAGIFARVRVRCRSIGVEATTIRVAPTASGTWQPCVEWNAAATRGVALGLRLAKTTADCEITFLQGTDVDTVGATMAIAGIRAVWQALGFRPPTELAGHIEKAIERSGRMTLADLEADFLG